MKSPIACLLVCVVCAGVSIPNAYARIDTPREGTKKGSTGPSRVLVLDGSTVHNVGELQLFVSNWGNIGSWPGSQFPFSEAPSAQWPAGSGIEYLFAAGLWVGAIKSNIPAVTTAAFEFEFRPTSDTRDIMYRSAEGAGGGDRLPSPSADDDGDGAIDEDWLNGFDDDGDGFIDEDYAAVSKQMFSCQYVDNDPVAVEIFPEHNPLNIHVRQESYQWEEDRFDDFVGANFWVTNVGNDVLENIFVGFFADADAGNRTTDNYFADDISGFKSLPVHCTDLGPVSIDIAYTYDADSDDGKTLGYFGILFLGHTTDATGETAPERVGIYSYLNFSGAASFEDGGDPTNDFERYELLSSGVLERNAQVPRDYRMMLCAGPFAELLPGSTLVFQTGFVAGEGFEGLIENASAVQLTFQGAWFNLDGNPLTGVAGRETAVKGPVDGIVIDSCREELSQPINYPNKDFLYINNDCKREQTFQLSCGYTLEDSTRFMTGVGGQEKQLFWIIGTAPPPPSIRVDDTSTDGVAIYWDNFSETQADVKTQVFDFEGYRLWRADNWDRPFGSSSENGPSATLWKLLFEIDIVNNHGPDTGLDRFRYEPLTGTLTPAQKRDMIESIKRFMLEYPTEDPPCPQGVSRAVCDTLVALAGWELGTRDGRRFYRYVDRSMHRGRPYFYAVTASDHDFDENGRPIQGKVGDPSSNFVFIEPATPSQQDYAYKAENVYVVPNPATTESMAAWTLSPNNDDPTGIKIEFRNLPADRGIIRIFTLAGDLVQEISFDGRAGAGTAKWDLVSRNGQDVTSGVYLYAVETDFNQAFERKIGKFVVIR